MLLPEIYNTIIYMYGSSSYTGRSSFVCQVKRHQSAVEAGQEETRSLRSSHTEEVRRLRQDVTLVQDQLGVNREEVSNLQSALAHQQSLTEQAENVAEQWNTDCLAARQQVSYNQSVTRTHICM